MNEFRQGDIIRISGFRNKRFLVISKNTFIRATGFIHVCPMSGQVPPGPVHIPVRGKMGTVGTALCEDLKLIDPAARSCVKTDWLTYGDIMNVSDTIQGIFEYD